MSRKSKLGFFAVALIAFGLMVGALLQSHRWDWLPKPIGGASPIAPGAAVINKSKQFDLVTLAKKARSAVALIEVFNEKHNSIGSGSGFFVSDDGLLITNYHVIERASSAVAKTSSGNSLSIKGAAYFDRDNDLVALIVEGNQLRFLPLANSSSTEIGDRVAVIGSPLGLEGSSSKGIVSAKRELSELWRPLPMPASVIDHYSPRRNFDLPVDKLNWLQITVPISPGSSGSPVLDAKGNVIGIATMVLRGGQSLNFAVPSETVIAMLQTDRGKNAKQRPLIQFRDLLAYERSDVVIIDSAINLLPEVTKVTDALFPDTSGSKERPDLGKALDAAKTLVTNYPEIIRTWSLLGKVYEKMGLLDAAISAYQQATMIGTQRGSMNADPCELWTESGILTSCWASLGSLFKKSQQMAQSQFAFAQAISLQKKTIECRAKEDENPPKGFTAEEVSRLEKARAEARCGEFNALADYYTEAGDVEHAEQALLQAVRENPSKGSRLEGELLDALANLCVKNSDERAAFTKLYDAMVLSHRENPEAEAWHALAKAYFGAGEEERARRCYGNAEKLGQKR